MSISQLALPSPGYERSALARTAMRGAVAHRVKLLGDGFVHELLHQFRHRATVRKVCVPIRVCLLNGLLEQPHPVHRWQRRHDSVGRVGYGLVLVREHRLGDPIRKLWVLASAEVGRELSEASAELLDQRMPEHSGRLPLEELEG
eukprot:3934078-Rhodomonas_salina.2